MSTNRDALEATIASDPELADPAYSATLQLARDLADELDAQLRETKTAHSRLQATYAGQLAAIRRIIRDARDRRRREQGRTPKEAGRLAHIMAMADTATPLD